MSTNGPPHIVANAPQVAFVPSPDTTVLYASDIFAASNRLYWPCPGARSILISNCLPYDLQIGLQYLGSAAWQYFLLRSGKDRSLTLSDPGAGFSQVSVSLIGQSPLPLSLPGGGGERGLSAPISDENSFVLLSQVNAMLSTGEAGGVRTTPVRIGSGVGGTNAAFVSSAASGSLEKVFELPTSTISRIVDGSFTIGINAAAVSGGEALCLAQLFLVATLGNVEPRMIGVTILTPGANATGPGFGSAVADITIEQAELGVPYGQFSGSNIWEIDVYLWYPADGSGTGMQLWCAGWMDYLP